MSSRGYPNGNTALRRRPAPLPDNQGQFRKYPGKTGFPLPYRPPRPSPGFGRKPVAPPRVPLRPGFAGGLGGRAIPVLGGLLLGVDLLDQIVRPKREMPFKQPQGWVLHNWCDLDYGNNVYSGCRSNLCSSTAGPCCLSGQPLCFVNGVPDYWTTSSAIHYSIKQWDGQSTLTPTLARGRIIRSYVRPGTVGWDAPMVPAIEPGWVGPSPLPFWSPVPMPYPGPSPDRARPVVSPAPPVLPDPMPGEMPPPRNPVPVVQHSPVAPRPREKEKKGAADRKAWWLANVYGKATEVLDALDAAWKSIPPELRSKSYYKGVRIRPNRETRNADVYKHFTSIEIDTFIKNFMLMQLEDFLIGKSDPNRQLNKASGINRALPSRFDSQISPKVTPFDVQFKERLAQAQREREAKEAINAMAVENGDPWIDWRRFRADPSYRAKIEARYGRKVG